MFVQLSELLLSKSIIIVPSEEAASGSMLPMLHTLTQFLALIFRASHIFMYIYIRIHHNLRLVCMGSHFTCRLTITITQSQSRKKNAKKFLVTQDICTNFISKYQLCTSSYKTIIEIIIET